LPLLEPPAAHHVYVRSSYWLVSQRHGDMRLGGGSDLAVLAQLKRLLAAPSAAVAALLAKERARVAQALHTPTSARTTPRPTPTNATANAAAAGPFSAPTPRMFWPLPRVLVAVHVRMQVMHFP
jgi:hypothetical protein